MKLKLIAVATMAAGLALAGCASNRDNTSSSGASRSVGQYTSDAALTTKVKTALAADAGLSTAANVNVQSYRGVVQLNGFVNSRDEAQRAVEVASRVQGVSKVENHLDVKPGS